MKRKLIVVLTAFGLSSFGNSEGPPEKTTEEELLAQRNSILEKISEDIETFLWTAAENGKISGEEMFELRKKVRIFEKEQEVADEVLKNFGLRTSVIVKPKIDEAISEYFNFIRQADRGGKPSLIISSLAGKSVRVEGAFNHKIFWPLLAILFFSIALLVIGVEKDWEIIPIFALSVLGSFIVLLVGLF